MRYFLLSWGRKRQHRLGRGGARSGQGHLKSQRAAPSPLPTLPVGLSGAHGSCDDGGHRLVHLCPPAAVEGAGDSCLGSFQQQGHVHAAREHQCGSCLSLPPDPLAAPLVAFPCETQVGPGPHGRVSHRELVLFGFKYQETLCKAKQTLSGCIPPSQGLSSVKLQSESTLQSCLDSSLLGSAVSCPSALNLRGTVATRLAPC